LGPFDGYQIEDAAAKWSDFLGDDKRLGMVRSYVYLRARMLFDPPATSFALEAMKEQIHELEWRISVIRETEGWLSPVEEAASAGLTKPIDGGTP
jgi:hypothetical protein